MSQSSIYNEVTIYQQKKTEPTVLIVASKQNNRIGKFTKKTKDTYKKHPTVTKHLITTHDKVIVKKKSNLAAE